MAVFVACKRCGDPLGHTKECLVAQIEELRTERKALVAELTNLPWPTQEEGEAMSARVRTVAHVAAMLFQAEEPKDRKPWRLYCIDAVDLVREAELAEFSERMKMKAGAEKLRKEAAAEKAAAGGEEEEEEGDEGFCYACRGAGPGVVVWSHRKKRNYPVPCPDCQTVRELWPGDATPRLYLTPAPPDEECPACRILPETHPSCGHTCGQSPAPVRTPAGDELAREVDETREVLRVALEVAESQSQSSIVYGRRTAEQWNGRLERATAVYRAASGAKCKKCGGTGVIETSGPGPDEEHGYPCPYCAPASVRTRVGDALVKLLVEDAKVDKKAPGGFCWCFERDHDDRREWCRDRREALKAYSSAPPGPSTEEVGELVDSLRDGVTVVDTLMGDSDLDGDDSPEMQFMQRANKALIPFPEVRP